MKYLVIIEKINNNYSAYLPDVSGCIATGKTIEETKKNITEALLIHLAGLKNDGLPPPEPSTKVDYVAVS
ncbi:MAG: type II toxin-antitoxin system HicB family antitoxin [Actinobacteria bacterium]|jgi:predicted RNase H-like HicB family nuclease|nr:type II toxin-antitoxin system HicB family antitoxin [Actinomycetota bacterium]